jgi:hypothetical protein
MSLPLVFVGSSSEQLPLVKEILRGLGQSAVVRPWNTSIKPGVTTLDGLLANANEADFALFIFGPDDWTESRSVAVASPRDNVVFEAGMFGGLLGWRRSIIVHARGVKLPSDLLGLTMINYDASGDPAHEGRLVSNRIKEVIEELGWRGSEFLAGQMQGYWWQFTLSEARQIEKSALSLIEVRRAGRDMVLDGRAWTAAGDRLSKFSSKATSVDEHRRALFYYWEGFWPGTDLPTFSGTGEIVVEDTQRASGYFTARLDRDPNPGERMLERDPNPAERKHVAYRRATAPEIEVMNNGTDEQRKALIRTQLDERKGLLFAG